MVARTLLDRCQGPGALPVSTLVKRAELAAEIVVREYGSYMLGSIDELERLALLALRHTSNTKNWGAFITALRDVQSSSAMAESRYISQLASALLDEVIARGVTDPDCEILIELHIAAIRIAASGKATEGELISLTAQLERVTSKLR